MSCSCLSFFETVAKVFTFTGASFKAGQSISTVMRISCGVEEEEVEESTGDAVPFGDDGELSHLSSVMPLVWHWIFLDSEKNFLTNPVSTSRESCSTSEIGSIGVMISCKLEELT